MNDEHLQAANSSKIKSIDRSFTLFIPQQQLPEIVQHVPFFVQVQIRNLLGNIAQVN